MENSVIVQCSMASIKLTIVSAIVSFFVGVFVKYLFNKFVTPKITIDKLILPDTKTKKPYIKINNKSFLFRAYDIHVYLAYLKLNDGKFQRFHTGIIKEVVLKTRSDGKYSITPKDNELKKYDAFNPEYRLGVVLMCKNRFGTYSIKEQVCIPDTVDIRNQ